MDKKREILELDEFVYGMETGWETVRKMGKLDKSFTEGLIKKHIGKSCLGKIFRFAYIENENGRFWIKPKAILDKVTLAPDGVGYWRWHCPSCEGKFTYSPSINYRWGIPKDKVYCAVCKKHFIYEKEEQKLNKEVTGGLAIE